ncbi:MAG TPA: glyoxylate/hydroxypyruvate reductase A [Nevskiales bacterium]|nr:glyoxylate/hydroxypyruvate reductase A [Nevskiales bacterium]
MAFLYKADPERGAEWARLFAERAPDLPFRIWPDIGDPAEVRYLGVWEPPQRLAETFPNLEIVFSLGAGVDQLELTAIPEHIPVVRMVEPGITDTMAEYVTLMVLALHRDLITYIGQQRARQWQPVRVRPAAQRCVGILGLGALGGAVARRLTAIGFPCLGWSRSRRAIAGVTCYAGAAELPVFLHGCQILVCLLPLTAETRGFLDRALFAQLPPGAALVNVGRGAHLVAQDLLDALDSGHLSGAVLDVTEPEPLPAEHPFWTHPRILLTPHIASMTQPESAVEVVLDNIRKHCAGTPMTGVVNRRRGY